MINLSKMKSLVIKKFTIDITQELKLMGQQMSYDLIIGKWKESVKESLSFLFDDKAYEKW
jgi:hypothetical protein